MKVSYRTLSSVQAVVDLPASATIAALRAAIAADLRVPPPELVLIFHGSVLPDSAPLSIAAAESVLAHHPSVVPVFELRPPDPPPAPALRPPPEEIDAMTDYICDTLPWLTRARAREELERSGYSPELVLDLFNDAPDSEHEEEEEVALDDGYGGY
jgi:hypothetical protein